MTSLQTPVLIMVAAPNPATGLAQDAAARAVRSWTSGRLRRVGAATNDQDWSLERCHRTILYTDAAQR